MTSLTLRQLWKNEYFRTAVMIVLIVAVVFGFWFGLRLALNNDYPMLAVASGSMSTVHPDSAWFYPFSRTLHTGDLIIVQAVRPQDIYAAPFNESGRSGDILVFRPSPGSEELIVHRAVGWYDNTTLKTQGDGNTAPGPPFDPLQPGKVPVNLVIGKVILRIPWIGNVALLMRDQSGLYLILALIIIVVAVELIFSISGHKESKTEEKEAPASS
jgi:signal peptidase I